MDENRLSGAARNVGGKIEEGIGSLASDAKTQVQGKLDQATGAVRLQLCELISSAAKQKLIAYQRALWVLIVKRCLPLS